MENQPTEENYNRDLNANPNENVDDEPYPPPGLSRLVTGQTYSFDEGPNSPPFDRVIPGDAEPFQMFPSVSKKNNYGNTFANDNAAANSSQDFFDSYLRNSSTPDNDLVPNTNKNKFASQYFSLPDTEKRETFLQQDVSRIPPNAYDGASNKNANVPYNNFKSRPMNQPFVSKPPLKGAENLYDSISQPPLPANRVENVQKFEHNAFVMQHENDQIVENREKPLSHLQQNTFPLNSDSDRRNEPILHDPSSDRMAIEGSCDTASYPKPVPSSTPMQSPNYDFWYKNDPSNSFVEHQDIKNPYNDDIRLKRDSNYSGSKYGADKIANIQNAPPMPSNMHFAQSNSLQMPQEGLNMHSKTPSISSNTSSMNEASGYQQDKFMSEQKRIDHYNNSEVLDTGNSLTNYDIPANVANKQNLERPKNFDAQHSDNDFANDPRQLQKLDLNRETFENNDDREISHYTDSDERPIGKRTVLGYNNNTIPRTRKNVDRPIQDDRTRKQYSYDTSHIKGNKMEPPLEQRLVVGETSSDAAVVQNAARTRDNRPYNDEKSKRSGKESLSGRSDKSRKKPSYDRRDRRKIESDDDDYDESIDRSYDDAPGPDSRSYHDLYYRSSPPHRFEKRLPRRHPENSFTQSQDESYYDDDDEDDNYSYRGQRKYYDRRPPREPSYRHYYHDQFHREERKYRRGGQDLYGRYEDDSFYGDRNSRPSSRSGSELFRPSPFAGQRYYPKCAGYEYLDHRELIRHGGVSRMKKEEIEYWSSIREANPNKYMAWFKDRFPKQYADWYARFYSKNVVPTNAYQADRRGSGHSGQSSVNDTLSVKEEGLLGMNEQSMFRPVQSEANSIIQEQRCSPAKFSFPHVKGAFNSLGQLIEVNACAPQDGQTAKVDIKKLPEPKDPDWIEFFNFTGPFIPGETHVHTVSQFLKYHADTTTNSSKKLLYFLIDLIIKLRGVADGIAVSELLTASYAESQRTSHLSERDEDAPPISDYQSINEAQIIENYTNLLLQGDKHSALELAVNNKLWGHAFLLASKMGTKYYSNVLAKFDASISVNNPLKTLYQLHSNQIPLAATACSDEKWGDWRPHLAMILSNPTSGNDLDKTSIITLGDSLASKDIYAAHFCYLAAEMDFDPPSKIGSKFSLLSWRNNDDNFNISTPNHAILLTQTYEFAKRLQRKDFTISTLLPYKYLLATRLLDYNRSSVALQYLESIALDLMKNPCAELHDLMYNVLELSERIKFSDSKPLVSDSGDKEWLTKLRELVDNFSAKSTDQNSYQRPRQLDQSHHMPSFQQTPLTQPLPPQISSPSQQPPLYSPVEEPQPPLMFQPSPLSQPPTSLPASMQNSTWDNPSFQQSSLDLAPSGGFMQPPANKSVDINDNISPQQPTDYHQPSSDYPQPSSYNPWDQPQVGSISMHSSNNYFNDNTKPNKSNDLHDVSKRDIRSDNCSRKYEMAAGAVKSYYSTEKLYQLKRLKNKNFSLGNENSLTFMSCSRTRRIWNSRDYGALGDSVVSRRHFRSLSQSKIVFNGTFPIDRPFRIRDNLCSKKLQLRHENSVPNRPPESQSPAPTSGQDEDKNGDKKSENGKWLGWLSKITRSNTHVAKLPDDKDPSLVFDPKIGRWVDKDSKGDDGGEKFQPPPMASEFKSAQKVDHEPINRGSTSFYDQSEPAGPPASSRPPNAYSLRGKGMKAHYVNVLANNKSTVRPPNLPTPPGFSSS